MSATQPSVLHVTPKSVKYEGWLTKQGKIVKSWKVRWFVLENGQLTYFKKRGDKKAKGNLVITGCPMRPTESLKPGFEYGFQLETKNPDRIWYFLAESEIALQGWREHLSSAGARWVNFQSSVVHADGGIEEQALGDVELLVQNWLLWDRNPVTRRTIEALVEKKDLEALAQCMRPRIEFGTAGLRAAMRAGFRYMNDLTVLQATQGLVRYLGQESVMPGARKRGIVVGYDARHNSRAFADIVGRIFAADGFRVYFFSRIVPTPFVPFAISALKACAGVMITASHNPKDDNGYKLYWENACQINSPHDKEISKLIQANQEPWPARALATRPCSGCLAPAAVVCVECDEIFCPECDGIVHEGSMTGHSRRQMFESEDPTEQVAAAYYQALASPAYCREPVANASSTLRVTYTPMHGVGKEWAARAFAAFKLPPYTVVPEQIEPDPDFPTVPFPNPEEGKGALHLAMKTADASGCSLIVANDPDADRLAVAEKLPAPGPTACSCGHQDQGDFCGKCGARLLSPEAGWRIFSGNEVGALLAAWAWDSFRRLHPDIPAEKCAVVNSTVSSKFLSALATREGLRYAETLTGFKWIGNVGYNFIQQGCHYVFGFEESIGYTVGDLTLDKDGIRGVAAAAELAGHLHRQKKTLTNFLDELYDKYGYFQTRNRYLFCYDPNKLPVIFGRLRANRQYPTQIGGYKVAAVRDLTEGYDSREADLKPRLPVSKSTEMITFYFENGCIATLRGSGTEPKLKYYVEMSGNDRVAVGHVLDKLVPALIEECLRPAINGLEWPSE